MSTDQEFSGLIKIFSHRILFLLHLFAYVAVNLLLILIWAVLLPTIPEAILPKNYFLPFFPIFGWGFGIGAHSLVYLTYNDKIKYLSEIRSQAKFKLLFIFHTWFYGSINIFLLILNLTTNLTFLWFLWPLGGWGISFIFHFIGFQTWDKSLEVQKTKLREKHPDYSEERLKEFATSKLLGIEVLLLHITYFAVITVLTYTTEIWLTLGSTIENILQTQVGWSLFLGLHVLAYYLFNYDEKLSITMKGLILHVIAYVGLIFIGLWEQLSPGQIIFWWHIPVILWLFFIGFHILVTLKWDSINPSALEKVKGRSREGLEEYKYQRMTYWVLFWQFTFIAHICAYIVGLILILFSRIPTTIAAGLSVVITVEASDVMAVITFGWLIGLLVHGAMYVIALKQITALLMWTVVLHSAAYIGGIPLLVVINILFTPTLLWSAIALGGWAIGLGVHLLLAFLTRKK
ncbi:hypothetical protein LCGC14_0957070 [marine sediment metagenome]|uniref:2TM domain-containing protein n=1 Tax=marine sediment metagenome TaxID=412755 RepID=A0A0F9NFL2_9ZZZZ|nr:MAG: hypothetical protein Lokiarch_25920 [Candidatus Lokiarchaeum sp. GC14_75]